MEASEIRHRVADEPSSPPTGTAEKSPRDRKMALAKRGLRSLAVAVLIPVLLGLLNVRLGHRRVGHEKPLRSPVWVHDLGWVASHALMGLSSWLVWVEGGVRRQARALSLYALQLLLGVAWVVAFALGGATRVAFAFSLFLLAGAFGCYWTFRRVNPIAGDIFKPCLLWFGFLVFVNYKLLL